MSNIGPKKLPTLRDSKDPEQLDVFQREVREAFRQVARDTADSITNVTNIISSGTGLVNSVTGTGRIDATPTTGDVIVSVDVTDLETDIAGKAPLVHTHAESDITGLVADLASKLPAANVSGTNGKLAMFTGANTLGDSLLSQSGVTINSAANISVNGNFTVLSGNLVTIGSATSFTNGGAVTISGNTTLGDANTDAHTLNGTLNANATAGTNGQVLQIVSGLPKWDSPATLGATTGTGTANKLTKWTGATTLGDSIVSESGAVATVSGALKVSQGATTGVADFGIINVEAGDAANTYVSLKASAGNEAGLLLNNTTGTADGGVVYDAARTLHLRASGNVNRLSINGTKVSTPLYMSIARAEGSSPELDFVQGGRPTWALYNHTSANTFALWRSDLGDLLFFDATGAAQLNTSFTVINDFAVNGNTTIGNAGGDTLDVNCDLSKFGTTGGDGAVYIRNQGIHGAYSTNATAGLYINETGYQGGATQFRDLFVMDGKGALIIDVDGASKQTDFYGNVLARLDLRVLGDLLVDGDMVINDAVNGTITARELEADFIATPTGSGGNIEADGSVIAKTGFLVGDPAGSPTTGYIYVGTQRFTASGTYTPTPNTRVVRVRMTGGGGGGGGAQGGNACGGGGASGVYWEKVINPAAAITGGAVTIGAAGAAGSTGGGNGGTGGDTSVVIQTVTYTAKGGLGGTGMLTPAGTFAALGGQVQAGSSAGDVVLQGTGSPSTFINGSFYYAGNGGSNPLGGGGGTGALTTSAAGKVGTGFGAGGGGGQGAAQAGGAGTAGVVIIEEYA